MAGRVAGLVVAFFAMTAAWSGAGAFTYADIHDFCKEGRPCPKGETPTTGNMTVDPSGNVFGTTVESVFELIPAGGGKWKFKSIHNFCNLNCTISGLPAGLISDVNGVLYGTTRTDGANSQGTAYKLIPNAGGTRYRYVKLYDFCTPPSCTDGPAPGNYGFTYAGAASGAFYDGKSPLYGVIPVSQSNGGYVFELKKGKTGWTESTLYEFCPNLDSCPDGAEPAQISMDATGKTIYGVADAGGASDEGAFFQLSAKHNAWKETVLHSFCAEANCTDGSIPLTLVTDGAGNFYGTSWQGGDNNKGVVFQYNPTSNQYTRRYSFCAQTNCADGREPTGLAIDGQGNLFGATTEGGLLDAGLLFEIAGSDFTILHNFCNDQSCPDIAYPQATPLIVNGDVLGTASNGGKYEVGGIYELTP
jgi:uncharacterized repeat protein (TIGR03803 family)